jgi:CheY-like chemotaxis protein
MLADHGKLEMSLRDAISSELPFLRRYARALTGSQEVGDAAVRGTLEALLQMPHEFDLTQPTKVEFFHVFHKLWNAETLAPLSIKGRSGVVAQLPVQTREALLLTAIESFSISETAAILSLSKAEVQDHVMHARIVIDDALIATVMIIEDESIIALHLKSIVEALGHNVIGVVRTRDEAVTMAQSRKPELVLADISLADGSSGIDAVKDILEMQPVPVIFITAFPERLLTGERPEPTYLITKPFEPETVLATIGQALLVHRETTGADADAC